MGGWVSRLGMIAAGEEPANAGLLVRPRGSRYLAEARQTRYSILKVAVTMSTILGNRTAFVLVLAIGLAWAGCLPPDEPAAADVEAPPAADFDAMDPQIAERAREVYAEARQAPNDAEKRAALGMIYEVSGLTDAALLCYEQAALLDPTEPKWAYFAALILGKWRGDLEGALEQLDRAIALDGQYPSAYLYRGQWMLDLGDPEAAMAAYKRAAELEPRFAPAWIGQARVHMRMGDPEKALQILEPLEKVYQDSHVYQFLGQAYRQAGQMDKAREALSKRKPGGEISWQDPWHQEKAAYVTGFGTETVVAQHLMESGRYEEAIELINKLLEEHPGDPALQSDLAVAYLKLGRVDVAFGILEEAIAREPGYYPFHVNIARCYAMKKDLPAAVRSLDRALEIHPHLATAHESRGIYLGQMGRFEESREAFLAAVAADARRTKSLFRLAFFEVNDQDWAGAQAYLEQLLEIDPTMGQAHAMLAMALAEQGELAAADRSLARAGELLPDGPELQQIRQRVEQARGRHGAS